MSFYGLAAGQTADRLIHHCLENGDCQIFFGSSLIDQWLDVCFGKNTAPGGDGVDGIITFGVLIQTGCIGLKKAGHLIDK